MIGILLYTVVLQIVNGCGAFSSNPNELYSNNGIFTFQNVYVMYTHKEQNKATKIYAQGKYKRGVSKYFTN